MQVEIFKELLIQESCWLENLRKLILMQNIIGPRRLDLLFKNQKDLLAPH